MEPENAEIPVEQAAERMGLVFSKDAPMTIDSDELEVVRDDSGRERVVFQDNVRVVQGDLRLDCDWLRATYPKGAGGRPTQIVARGSVRMRQQDSEVLCTQAVFDDKACTAVCTSSPGPAELRRGENVIRGDEIIFDLCTGHLKVRGSARVRVMPKEEGS